MAKSFGNKNTLVILSLLVVLFLILRLPNLTSQPIFADEAIYIRWAQIAKSEPSLRFISLQDGKTPLYMWAMAPFLMIFSDPLWAGRFLSVLSGLATMLGVYFLGRRFFNNQIGLIGAFLITTTPFMIFFNRLALVDSMLAAFTIWGIYFGLKLSQTKQIKDAVILGFVLGGGWLTKTPGLINVVLLPLYSIFFDFSKKNFPKGYFKYGSIFGISAVIAVGLYVMQRIDPNFHLLSSRNSDYIHPWSRLLQYPFDPFVPHLKDSFEYLGSYFGIVLILLIPGALILPFVRKNRVAILLLLWSMIPFLYELQFIKAFTARYFLFSIPPLLVLIAWELNMLVEYLSRKIRFKSFGTIFLVGILVILSGWPVFFASRLLNDPASAPLARAERRGYLEDWTAGYGLKEIAEFLIGKSQNETIVVGTEGSFGTLPDGMVIYLDKYFHSPNASNIVVLGGKAEVSDTVRNFASEKPTYFVANKSRLDGGIPPDLKLIKEYPKAIGPDLRPDSILFFQVFPLSESSSSAKTR